MTLRDQPCYRELGKEVVELAGGRSIVLLVNTGNWGDSLIHAGQDEFFKEIGVRVRKVIPPRIGSLRQSFVNFRSFLTSRNALICGGGALREHYKRPQQFELSAKPFNRLLVLPSSFPLVPKFDPVRTSFWRRDNDESLDTLPTAKFCHDMAFFLAPRPRPARKPLGIVFRNDVERADYVVPAGNQDISAEGIHSTSHEGFLDRIGEFEVIHTNRLHAAIAGALLGREVHMYSSVNRKQESIFKSSLEPFYKNVYFHNTPPAPDLNEG